MASRSADTVSPPSSPEREAAERCACRHYHSQGQGCPCSARYATKVGRKAIDRILNRSKFFHERNVLIQNEEEHKNSLLDESNHSTANQILSLDPKSLELGVILGKGGFCVVHETHLPARLVGAERDSESEFESAHEHGHREHEYCVKFLKSSAIAERKKFARGIADLAIEAHFLASLNHPHILKIRGVSEGFTLFEPSSPLFLSTLTCKPGLEGGCFLLLDRLVMTLDKKINRDWKEWQIKWNSFLNRTIHDIRGVKRRMFRLERVNVALQLAQAMQYLHQHSICYRDLKPDNIGFDSQDSLKLFDFGLAKELKEFKRHADGTYQLTANTGSKRYMAPEVASRARYNLAVDVFSYGILFWEICSLEKPFDGFTEMQHMNLVVQRGHRPKMDTIKCWPLSVRHIISRCWHPISNERPDFRQVVNALIQVHSEMTDSI
jgi:serine/threonine protein kinase